VRSFSAKPLVPILAPVVALALTPGIATASPSHARSSAQVYVVQGVPRDGVSAVLDGKTLDDAMDAKDIVGPLDVSQGMHRITFSAGSWKVSSSFKVNAGSADVVLHWPADPTNKPEVSVFANNVAPVGTAKGRLTVAHTAVVPPADVRVDKKVLFSNIANGEFVTADVPGGTYSVDVVPTGQSTHPLLGPVDLPVQKGALTRVFAIGQPKNGSMDAIVQVIPLKQTGSAAPRHVDAGSAGLAATNRSMPTDHSLTGPLVLIGGLGGLGMTLLLARRRQTR